MTPRGTPRTRPIDRSQVAVRAATARKYVEVGELVMGEDPADRQVAAGLAVLAAIAASDAICGDALGEHAQGQDHAQALPLLRTVQPDGATLATKLGKVLEQKSNAHYGLAYLSTDTVRGMVRNARALVAAMDDRLR